MPAAHSATHGGDRAGSGWPPATLATPPFPASLPVLSRSARAQDVTDGDLCEQFSSLPMATQRTIAGELDRTPSEVLKKLEDLRNCIL